ncbi:MAG: hypothetical protein ACC669_04630 [bacterium]
MRIAVAIILLLPSISFAYSPPADELLKDMAKLWDKARPASVNLVLETADGEELGKVSATLPLRGKDVIPEVDLFGQGGYLPFHLLTVDKDSLFGTLRTRILGENPSVRLDRLDSVISYLIEGDRVHLWLRKDDLMPVKSEILTQKKSWTTALYLETVSVGNNLPYPARTEISRDGELLMIERLSTDIEDDTTP